MSLSTLSRAIKYSMRYFNMVMRQRHDLVPVTVMYETSMRTRCVLKHIHCCLKHLLLTVSGDKATSPRNPWFCTQQLLQNNYLRPKRANRVHKQISLLQVTLMVNQQKRRRSFTNRIELEYVIGRWITETYWQK